MGNILADLLSAQQPDFGMTIQRLEKASGNPGVDVRLMGEVIQSVRSSMESLELDRVDTTGEELYYALLGKAKRHDEHLAKHIGVKDDDDVDKIAMAIKRVIEKSKINQNSWSVKKSVLKKMLQKTPPTKVMAVLNFSSVDSMIKRGNIIEIMAAARLLETPTWLKKFNRQYQQLTPSDFEDRKIEILVMPSGRWLGLANDLYKQRKYSLTHFKELGFLALFAPEKQKLEGYTLSILPLALHYINEIRLYSAFFKLQQVQPDFGKILVAALNEDSTYDIKISGKKLHWRVVQRHYGQYNKVNHPDVFQPHIQSEDLHWQRYEESLYQMNPELSFWKDLDYVGVLLKSDQPISFNILDASMNYFFAVDYKDRIYSHMVSSLWSELYMRYLAQPVFENQVQRQLNTDMLNVDGLRF